MLPDFEKLYSQISHKITKFTKILQSKMTKSGKQRKAFKSTETLFISSLLVLITYQVKQWMVKNYSLTYL